MTGVSHRDTARPGPQRRLQGLGLHPQGEGAPLPHTRLLPSSGEGQSWLGGGQRMARQG